VKLAGPVLDIFRHVDDYGTRPPRARDFEGAAGRDGDAG
jgi:hypothetical protein